MLLEQNFEQVLFDSSIPVRVLVQRLKTYRFHWHIQPELLYVVKGSISIHIESEDYILQAGGLMYISGNELHGINQTGEDNLLVAIQFDIDFFRLLPELNSCFFRRNAFMQNQQADPAAFDAMRTMIANIVWEYNKQPKGFRYMIAAQAYILLAKFIREDYFTERPLRTSERDASYQRISHVLNYISEHYADNLSLQTLAEQVHLSYYHLSRLFKEITGIPFTKYLCSVRLHKSTKALKNTKDSILTIALNHGFSTAKSYTTAFNSAYGVTPGNYRKQFQQGIGTESISSLFLLGNENDLLYASINSEADLTYIYSMIAQTSTAPTLSHTWQESRDIRVNTQSDGTPIQHSWSMVGSCGSARDLLRTKVQEQVVQAAKQLGYRYLRFHGIFCDDMMIFNRRADGTIRYNYIYVDQVFDFLLEHGLRPFLDMTFMPSELASGTNVLFFYRANITKPNDLEAWSDMVSALIRHCIQRYGYQEVASWYVEVWNEPDYRDVFWAGTLEDYLALYEASARAVKSACPDLKVGGPAITHIHYFSTRWIEHFLTYCKTHTVPVDFVSFHVYADLSSNYSKKGDGLFPKMSTSARIRQDLEVNLIETHMQTIQAADMYVSEFHASEWNVSAKPRFRIRDTAFMGPYIIHTALACHDRVHSLTFWTISDLMEELKAPVDPFHGGLGLINAHGIPKPSFWAFFLLNKLGDVILQQGDSYIVTQRDDCFQILLYNLAHLDQLAQQNTDFSTEYKEDLYALFEEKPTLNFHIQLAGLTGTYRSTSYALNREDGSVYDAWVRMGSPTQLGADETSYLRSVSSPRLHAELLTADADGLSLEARIPIHGCKLILLSPTQGKHA